MRQSPHGISYEAYRPVVMGRRGMVASGHPLASQAGIAVLQRGGNAVDAAVAVAAAVSVVEPGMSGIGGDGFIMLYHRPGTSSTWSTPRERRPARPPVSGTSPVASR